MCRKINISILFLLALAFSCKKADKTETKLQGTWERVVFNHNGTEQWTFTPENNLYVTLSLPGMHTLDGGLIDGDTVCSGTYSVKIVHYKHGVFLNKNIFNVPEITIDGLINYKYAGGNMDFTAYNTLWQVHKLNATELIITTDLYNNLPGGLEQREFYKQ
ncbi:MAG: hypothetical protein BWY70_01550 [Bacteroidetes bacterium ADurb.Bin408]|nr:MAG: hypothetical protein BWY70_01550 [Bacteroidetes bacterium ADurb.Bin408]